MRQCTCYYVQLVTYHTRPFSCVFLLQGVHKLALSYPKYIGDQVGCTMLANKSALEAVQGKLTRSISTKSKRNGHTVMWPCCFYLLSVRTNPPLPILKISQGHC